MTTHLNEKLNDFERYFAAANAVERQQVAHRMRKLMAGAGLPPRHRAAYCPETAGEADLFDNVPV